MNTGVSGTAGPRSGFGPWRGLSRAGHWTLASAATLREILGFGLITIGSASPGSPSARRIIRPLLSREVHRAGWRLLPLTTFVAMALGSVVIGQTIALLNQVGARDYSGLVLTSVVIRELGPLTVALLALARAGTAHVVELGTVRALGELEALESLGVDPVRYLVLPRVVGLALAVMSLTLWFLLVALVAGYVFALVQHVPLTPGDYVRQLALALRWSDFPVLLAKSAGYGGLIAAVSCHQGLLRQLQLEDIPGATTRAVVQSVVGCLGLDLAFLAFGLLL